MPCIRCSSYEVAVWGLRLAARPAAPAGDAAGLRAVVAAALRDARAAGGQAECIEEKKGDCAAGMAAGAAGRWAASVALVVGWPALALALLLALRGLSRYGLLLLVLAPSMGVVLVRHGGRAWLADPREAGGAAATPPLLLLRACLLLYSRRSSSWICCSASSSSDSCQELLSSLLTSWAPRSCSSSCASRCARNSSRKAHSLHRRGREAAGSCTCPVATCAAFGELMTSVSQQLAR